VFWFSLQLFSGEFFLLRRIQQDTINVHVKYPLLLLDFNENWIFSTDFRKYSNIKFHENPSVGADLFHSDGQTDRQTWPD